MKYIIPILLSPVFAIAFFITLLGDLAERFTDWYTETFWEDITI